MDAVENVSKVGQWINTIELGSFDERRNRRQVLRDRTDTIKLRLPDIFIFIRFEWLDDLTKRLEILSIRVHCLALLTSSAIKLTMGVINAFAQWPSA